MRATVYGGIFAATVVAFAIVTAQAQQQAASPQSQPTAKPVVEEITVTGCIQREADYRRMRDAGRGGVAGTGVGVDNEYILTNVTTSGIAPAPTTTEPTKPAGTPGTIEVPPVAYELTGPNEGQVTQYVGRRVEITGRLKPAETDAGGKATGGTTAGQPPRGTDVISKDLKLRELEITSVREATGSCPAADIKK